LKVVEDELDSTKMALKQAELTVREVEEVIVKEQSEQREKITNEDGSTVVDINAYGIPPNDDLSGGPGPLTNVPEVAPMKLAIAPQEPEIEFPDLSAISPNLLSITAEEALVSPEYATIPPDTPTDAGTSTSSFENDLKHIEEFEHAKVTGNFGIKTKAAWKGKGKASPAENSKKRKSNDELGGDEAESIGEIETAGVDQEEEKDDDNDVDWKRPKILSHEFHSSLVDCAK
jgi:hypothetical protein